MRLESDFGGHFSQHFADSWLALVSYQFQESSKFVNLSDFCKIHCSAIPTVFDLELEMSFLLSLTRPPENCVQIPKGGCYVRTACYWIQTWGVKGLALLRARRSCLISSFGWLFLVLGPPYSTAAFALAAAGIQHKDISPSSRVLVNEMQIYEVIFPVFQTPRTGLRNLRWILIFSGALFTYTVTWLQLLWWSQSQFFDLANCI
jgi:hypothetical protein